MVSESWYQSLPEDQQRAIVTSAREAIALSHGMSGGLATSSWEESCARFEECYLMPAEERERMADIARPAWQDWIVNEFGMDENVVNEMLAEVERVGQQTADDDFQRYGQ